MIHTFQKLNKEKPIAEKKPKLSTVGTNSLQNNIQQKRDRLTELQNNRVEIVPEDHTQEITDNLQELEKSFDDLSSNLKRKLSITEAPPPIEPIEPIPKLPKKTSKPRVSRKAAVKL